MFCYTWIWTEFFLLLGITQDGLHKRRATSGKRVKMHKKRKFMLGRPAAMTRIGPKRVHPVRVRGGNIKERAIRLDTGSFSWGSEAISRKSRVLNVEYNASNNELVRTNTLVKGAIVMIDASPFIDWYKAYYGVSLGKTKTEEAAADKSTDAQKAKAAAKAAAKAKKLAAKGIVKKKNPLDVSDEVRAKRATAQVIDPAVQEQLAKGRVYARLTSRPGQVGQISGYVLEGEELHFYQRKMTRKR
jgi:small subunit ribosomal protein S8e